MTRKPACCKTGNMTPLPDNHTNPAKDESESISALCENLSAVAGLLPVAVIIYRDEECIYCNSAAETVTGYTKERLLKTKPGFISGNNSVSINSSVSGIDKDEFPCEILLPSDNGPQKWASVNNHKMIFNRIPLSVISLVDITELKLAQQRLMESEDRCRLLTESTSDVIFTMDVNLRMTYISPSVTRLRGFTVEEAMAQGPQDILTPESLKLMIEAYAEEMEYEKHGQSDHDRVRVLELEEYRKDGSTVWTESIFNALRDGDGRYIGLIGVTRDISERKRAEEERRRLIHERGEALSKVKVLSGMLPICSSCKNIRDDRGYWNQIESFIRENSEADFTHGLCPDCAKKLYPELG